MSHLRSVTSVKAASTAALAVCLLLSACGGDKEKNSTEASAPVATAAASASGSIGSSESAPAASVSEPAPASSDSSSAPAAEPDKPITITAQTYYTDEPAQSLWAGLLKTCGDKHKITVKHETVPGGDLIAKILQQGQSKTLPDLLRIDNPEVQQVAAAGLLHPLNEFGVNVDGIADGVVKASTYEGKVYGAQEVTNTLAIFYNTDLFAKAGATPPKTWDELKATSAKLSGDGKYGIAFSAKADYEGTWQFLPFFWSAGAELDKLDSPEAISALTLQKDLVNSKSASKSVVSWSQGDVLDQFISGKAAMMLNGPWNFPALKEAAAKGLKWDVSPMPVAKEGAPSGAPLGGEAWAIAKTGKPEHEKAAAKVINCMMSDEMMLDIAIKQGLIPTRGSVADTFGGVAEPQMKGFIEAVKTARARTGVVGTKYPVVGAAIYKALGAALVGGKTPEGALKAAQASLK